MAVGMMAGLGAALGAAKYAQDREAARRQRQQEATIAQWSPWTGMAAQRVQDPNLLADVGYGAMGGAMMGQQMGGGSAAGAREIPAMSAAPASAYNNNPTQYSMSPYQSNRLYPGQKMDFSTWMAMQNM